MKRFLIGISAALLSIAAFGTTLNPVQLLNPTGSTSGQTIVSTGASTAPGWGNVPVANVTGAAPSASPTFTGTVTIPTAATSSNTTVAASTAFVQNNFTNPSFPYGGGTPLGVFATTISATGLISPTSTVGIKGTAAADNAQAGSVGEYLTATGTATSLTSATTTATVSLSLTAGDWDVSSTQIIAPAGTTTTSVVYAGTSLSATTLGGTGSNNQISPNTGAGLGNTVSSPVVRVNVSTTTTVYGTVNVGFGVSTLTSTGFIRARRVR
ncbi:hypothetical protein ABH944_004849 [Caballeronia udeis]|uniref:Lipoprotein n=1 Tax=Caballeronia udeis TaxID=1232866 RepID=A0ABW8MME9_9BURK